MIKKFKGGGIKAQILRGATGTAGLSLVNTVLTLGVGIILARSLGPANYGVYSVVLSVIALLGVPAKAGIPTLMVREIAKNQVHERWGLIKGLIQSSNVFVIVYSLFAAFIVITVLYSELIPVTSERAELVIWALPLLPIIALGNLRGAALRGFRKAIQGQIPERLIQPLVLVFLVCLILFLGNSINPKLVIQLNSAAGIAAFLVGVYLLLLKLPAEVKSSPSQYEHKKWLVSLLPLSLYSGMNLIQPQITVLLLGGMSSIENVGLFRVASQGAALLAFGLTAINLVLSPYVARLYNSGDLAELQNLITTITKIACLTAMPGLVVLLLFSEEIISFVFGEEYRSASVALKILCVGQFFSVAAGSVGLVLNMSGYERESLKAIAVSVPLGLLLTAVLVPFWGVVGASIATTVSLFTWNLLMMRSASRRVGISTFVFGKRRHK